MSDTQYCKDCKNMNCPEGRVNCKYPDAIACDLYRDTQQTVFEAITQSPEVLAPYCISTKPSINGDTLYYYSTVTGRIYLTEPEAIAATVERMKEVYR